MEILRAIGRFIVMFAAIFAALMLAPAILMGVSLWVISGNDANAGFVAFFYMAAGPFVSAVWTMLLPRIIKCWKVRRATGEAYKGGQAKTWGLFFFGFFGTLAAEAAFVTLTLGNKLGPKTWFVIAPFVVFLPLILVGMKQVFTAEPKPASLSPERAAEILAQHEASEIVEGSPIWNLFLANGYKMVPEGTKYVSDPSKIEWLSNGGARYAQTLVTFGRAVKA
jgi:hypothetical protein